MLGLTSHTVYGEGLQNVVTPVPLTQTVWGEIAVGFSFSARMLVLHCLDGLIAKNILNNIFQVKYHHGTCCFHFQYNEV